MDAYVRDNFTEMMPIDGPLTRVYLQQMGADEMTDLSGGDHRSLYIFKCHHAFGDGVSLGALTLASTDDYDLSYFPGARTATFWEVAYVRFSAFLAIPQIIWCLISLGIDLNLFTIGKAESGLSGKIHCTSSREIIEVEDLKKLTKAKNVTINDIVLGAFSNTLYSLFKESSLPIENSIQVTIPTNLRFSMYETVD